MSNVIFFPRKDYDVEVCTHRYGKLMAYTDQTDTIRNTNVYSWYSGLAQARNIKVGAFVAYSDFGNFPQIISDINNNKLWCDLYSQTTAPELLLDEETATEANFNNYYNTLWKPSFLAGIGKLPCALSYRAGKTFFSQYVSEHFLAGRNSNVDGNTDYGNGYGSPSNVPYHPDTFESKPSTLRWYDTVAYGLYGGPKTMEEEMAYLSSLIDACKINGGWIRNFTHWHNPYDDGRQALVEQYLDVLQAKNLDGKIWFCGFGEAVAYLAYRETITRAVMYSPKHHRLTQLIIRLETNNALNLDSALLQVPISVKFTTIGTPLAGQSIKCNRNLISLGNNEYIVEIPLPNISSLKFI